MAAEDEAEAALELLQQRTLLEGKNKIEIDELLLM